MQIHPSIANANMVIMENQQDESQVEKFKVVNYEYNSSVSIFQPPKFKFFKYSQIFILRLRGINLFLVVSTTQRKASIKWVEEKTHLELIVTVTSLALEFLLKQVVIH
jgi:hypothetical protein